MDEIIYSYLECDHQISPQQEPIQFLEKYIRQLPPHLLLKFSEVTTAKQRTVLTTVRNRRLKYVNSSPSELTFESARSTWPMLWQGRERRGMAEGQEEKKWASDRFLDGSLKHVGKLGELLGGYEEEREAARVRALRRQYIEEAFVPEEESDSEDDDEAEYDPAEPEEPESEGEMKASFVRLIRERFIYGLLEDVDYDKVDWNDGLDEDSDFEAQERWFDEE